VKLHAYVLAGDPAWAARSLRSYYDLVDKIVVAYDQDERSWSGEHLSVRAALHVLHEADPEHKIELLPGRFSDPSRGVLEVETEHRQAALDAASDGCDWVLQLDTDEILLSPDTFMRQLVMADARQAAALDYPLRDFYQYLGGHRYLERSSRFWGNRSAYPGPLAVRSASKLKHCRQVADGLYRVDLSWHNTDPWHPADARVHAVISPHQAVAHMSWVRTDVQMAEKLRTSGYAAVKNWPREIRAWKWRREHPLLTVAATPLSPHYSRFRIATLPFTPD
jgi:hypothetical protein